jgi:HSP20 family molecular chaperone IbpA
MYFYKRNRYPSVWHDMDRFQREMNRFFDEQERSRYSWGGNIPQMNVYTNDQEAIVVAELPGVDPAALEISVVAETLTIHPGDRIAQALLQRVEETTFEEVESLEDTHRNTSGFGSSHTR